MGFVGESLKCATKWRCNGTFSFFFEEWMEGQGEGVERERGRGGKNVRMI